MSGRKMQSITVMRGANRSCARVARRLTLVAAVLLCGQVSLGTPIAVTVGPWHVTFANNGDRVNYGGDRFRGEKNWTQAEMDDVAAMLTEWDSHITTAYPPRPIELKLMWNGLGTGVLGSSFNSYEGDGTHAWTEVEYLWRQHQNPNNTADSFIEFGTGVTWNTGSQLPASNAVDFRSVVLHEIGHTLGFFTTYNSTTDTWWSNGITAWDALLRDATTGGNSPLDNSTGTPGNFNQLASPVYFVGTNAMHAYGDRPVPVYAPPTYSGGSSLSHLDTATFPNALMKHAISYGASVRTPTVLEWRIMQDLGWDVTLTFLPGDANRDGVVDQADYTVWYNHYGGSGGWEQGDFNDDGLVDQADYSLWYNNYGSSSPVPEPTTMLLMVASMGILRVRRRRGVCA